MTEPTKDKPTSSAPTADDDRTTVPYRNYDDPESPHATPPPVDDPPPLDLERLLARLVEHAFVLETNFVVLGMVPSSAEVLIELMKGLLNDIETLVDKDPLGRRRGFGRLCDHLPDGLHRRCPWPACVLGGDREARAAALAPMGDQDASRGSTGSRRTG